MVQVIKKLRSEQDIRAQFMRNVEDMNSAVLEGLAEVAIAAAPVDTATYMTSFAIYEGTDLSAIPMLYSSEGREGGQDRGAYSGIAQAKLQAMISMLDHTQGNYVFGNEAEHRYDVEVTHGYGVFGVAAAAFPSAVAEARTRVGLT